VFAERYEQREVLGSGGMGEVLLCEDRELGRHVAVKISRSMSAISREMFVREAQIQGRLEHPSIVPVYDLGRTPDGQPYFAMKRVLGTSLGDILRRLGEGDPIAQKKYTRSKLLGAFVSVCLAIDFAHSRNVIHRDLKPANVMLGEFGEVYVLDWGIAKVVGESEPGWIPPPDLTDDSRETTEGGIVGTPGYMAPEQLRGTRDQISNRTDVYALGLILFEILTLEPMRYGRAALRREDLAIPPELASICERATEAEISERWASAREMAEGIERFLEGDRDLEMRHKAAEEHLHQARRALVRAKDPASSEHDERALALREASRAIALDPSDREASRTVLQILLEPPARLPPEAEREIEAVRVEMRRGSVKLGLVSTVIACVLLAFTMTMEIRQWQLLGLAYIVTSLAAIAGFLALRFGPTGSHRYLAVSCWTALLFILTRLFGPLIMIPSIATGVMVPMVLNATDRSRFVVALPLGVMLVTLFLEAAGVMPQSYRFTGDMMCILPQLTSFPPASTLALLTLSQLSPIAMTLLMVVRIRDRQLSAEKHLRLHAWYLRHLVR
jgi:serine/threonine-protein kinase